MNKIILILVLAFTLSSCGPVFIPANPGRSGNGNPPGWERNEAKRGRTWEENRDWNNRNKKYNKDKNSDKYSFLLFVNGSRGYRNLSIVIDNKNRIDLKRVSNSFEKEVRIRPGRHSIKVYENGRFLYSRWIDVRSGNRIKVVI